VTINQEKLERILPTVSKPGRYTGGEWNSVGKDWRATPTKVVMPGSQAVIDYVATHPAAIGYVSMGYLSPKVKALPIEGLTPTPETVQSGQYHLTRPLVVVTSRQPAGEVRAFLDFALSPAGQAVVGGRYGRVR